MALCSDYTFPADIIPLSLLFLTTLWLYLGGLLGRLSLAQQKLQPRWMYAASNRHRRRLDPKSAHG